MNLRSFTRRGMLGATLALLIALAACGGGGGSLDAAPTADPAGQTPPPPAAASFTISLSTQKAVVFQGNSVTLDATVTRSGAFDGAVELAVAGLPQGVSAAPASVAKGATTTQITLTAEAAAPHSLPTAASVKGTAGLESAQQPVTVTVRGVAGSVDTSFAGGKVTTDVGGTDDYVKAMAVQSDGKIVVAGYGNTGASTDFMVVRYERDGGLDASFGVAGKVETDVATLSDQAYAVAIQADGKILVAGSAEEAGKGKSFALVRYNADGTLDASFGTGGKVLTSFGSQSDEAFAMVVQADGRIVLGGHANTATRGLDFALARYMPNGTLDASFGAAGKVLTPVRSLDSRDSIYALALQTVAGQQHIVAAGGDGDFIIQRYTPDGAVDPSFGVGARLDGVFGSVIGAARAIVVTADNKIVVAGHVGHDQALVRLTETGMPDDNFGGAGRVITQVSATNWDEAHAVVQQADGKIVVGGWVYAGNGSSADFVVSRYTTGGTLDAAFGNGGITITAVAPGLKDDAGMALVLQADDRVPTVRSILGGSANDANYNFALVRYWH
jgi:uncharacterized delta-60 repeat protein